MEREEATQLLNKLVDDRIMQIKDEVEREIEAAIDGQLAGMKQWLLHVVDDAMEGINQGDRQPGDVQTSRHETSDLRRNESLLKGLDLLEKYYVQGIDELPLSLELRSMVEEARDQAERIRRFAVTEGAIGQTVKDLTEIDQIIHKHGADRGALIQILLDIQEQKHWLPDTALRWVSERLGVSLGQIYQIVTFYKAFSLKPEGRHHLKVCLGTACQVRGAQKLLERSSEILKLEPGQTDEQQRFTLSTVNCLGCCASAPVMVVDQDYYSSPSREKLGELVEKYN